LPQSIAAPPFARLPFTIVLIIWGGVVAVAAAAKIRLETNAG
jgi:hypothetical protein